MRKQRSSTTQASSPPPSARLSLGLGHSSFTPLPDGPRSLPIPNRDGPRSLPSAPSKRITRHWHALGAFDGPSYSSFARLAGRDDSANVVASVSLPTAPNVDGEGIRPTTPVSTLAPPRRRLHSALRSGMSAPHHSSSTATPPDPASLTRSDSLLNRARRYFSLPTSLKRGQKGPLLSTGERPRLEDDGPPSLGLGPGGLAYRRTERRVQRDGPPSGSTAGSGSGMALQRGPRRTSKTLAASLRSATPAPLPVQETPEPDNDASRIRLLEDQLEAARIKAVRQRRRIVQLEDELARDRQAKPALENLVQSAMRHFEAKEAALKHTIARLDHDYTTVVAEKNEAMRLLTAFVGRGGRSPPASFSSISEAGTESTHYKGSARRTLSMDTFRRTSPNSAARAMLATGDGEHGGERVIAE